MSFRDKKIVIIGGVLTLVLLFVTIVFAALTSRLNISFGNVTQNMLMWNVGFKGKSVTPKQEGTSTSGLSCGTASVTPSTVTVSDSELTKPGDKCIYSLVVENKGDLSASLSTISMKAPADTSCTKMNGSTMECGIISYKLIGADGDALTTGVTINKNEQYNIKLIIEYAGEEISELGVTQGNSSFTLTFNQVKEREGELPAGVEESEVSYEFDYAGKEETFEVPEGGKYKLEVWGAQGGYAKSTEYRGGYGGYSTGTIELIKGTKLYINVGGTGNNSTGTTGIISGGYNGGGDGYTRAVDHYAGGGGGATHIATSSGELQSLSSNRTSILIVAGGGGGGTQIQGGTAGNGSSSGTFGKGAGGTSNTCTAAGGGGYFGGGSSYGDAGGGGSGYIGNTLLSNQEMYCYKCTEPNSSVSNYENIKTISTTNVSDIPISKYAKKDNGYVKITYIDK